MATRGKRADRQLLQSVEEVDVSELITAANRPKLQDRSMGSSMITIPSEVVSIIGLTHGDSPTVQFSQDGLIVLDFRQEVATDGGEK